MSRSAPVVVAPVGRRTFVAGLLLLVASPAFAMARRPPRVLFICRFATAKSATARELLRKLAKQRGLALDVRSRGITPADHMPPQIRQRLIAEFGVDPASEPPHKLTQRDLDRADMVVLFDQLPPALHKTATLDWTEQPSLIEQFDPSMAWLQQHCEALLEQLAKSARSQAS